MGSSPPAAAHGALNASAEAPATHRIEDVADETEPCRLEHAYAGECEAGGKDGRAQERCRVVAERPARGGGAVRAASPAGRCRTGQKRTPPQRLQGGPAALGTVLRAGAAGACTAMRSPQGLPHEPDPAAAPASDLCQRVESVDRRPGHVDAALDVDVLSDEGGWEKRGLRSCASLHTRTLAHIPTHACTHTCTRARAESEGHTNACPGAQLHTYTDATCTRCRHGHTLSVRDGAWSARTPGRCLRQSRIRPESVRPPEAPESIMKNGFTLEV